MLVELVKENVGILLISETKTDFSFPLAQFLINPLMPGGNKMVTHTCLSICDLVLPPGIKELMDLQYIEVTETEIAEVCSLYQGRHAFKFITY